MRTSDSSVKKKRGNTQTFSQRFSQVRQIEIYLTIDELKIEKSYTVSELCKLFEIPRSSYYKWINRKKPAKEIQDEQIAGLILEYHKSFKAILGYRRMTMFINRFNQTNYSINYIHRLMKKMNIKSRIRRKRYNYIKMKPEQIGENILNRDFTTSKPNEKWLTDVTEFKDMNGNKLYLSAILDLYDKSIVAYRFSYRNDNQLVFETFDLGIKKNPKAKPIFHSDRGYQYTSKIFKYKLNKQGMTQSMSRVGKCIDNGPMESFWGTLKSEYYYGFKFKTRDEIASMINEYIHFYNNERLQAKLNSLAPIEYRNQAQNI